MAAELTIPRHQPRSRAGLKVYRGETKSSAFRRFLFYLEVLALIPIITLVIVGFMTYNAYSKFAEQIDQQIAGGYLRGHAGLYAAPRTIEKGAQISQACGCNCLCTFVQRG